MFFLQPKCSGSNVKCKLNVLAQNQMLEFSAALATIQRLEENKKILKLLFFRLHVKFIRVAVTSTENSNEFL